MRVAIVYDCLFPYTVGGAERWYRNVAERLAADGHEVTYLTLRQWPKGDVAEVPGVKVVAVGPRLRLYARSGRRKVLPPIVCGLGVLAHLLRRRRAYDVVHTASFPYFPLLAAGMVRRLHGFRLVVDWHEVWTRDYWREYLGPAGGEVGWLVQRLCVRLRQQAFCFSRLHERRLREEGARFEITRLEGEYAGPLEARPGGQTELKVVFAGRHIPEKRAPAVVSAVARARESLPELTGDVYGDGPQRQEVLRRISELGLAGVVEAPGFVDAGRVEEALGRALCLLLPSRREGYGLVVVEAAAQGTPSVVVEGADNAAMELVEDGVNGMVAASAEPEALAAAVLRVHEAGPGLRDSTLDWFRRNAPRLSIGRSLERVSAAYSESRR